MFSSINYPKVTILFSSASVLGPEGTSDEMDVFNRVTDRVLTDDLFINNSFSYLLDYLLLLSEEVILSFLIFNCQ